MYCYERELSTIGKRIVGLTLKDIYPDWSNGIIYLRFADSCRTELVAIKNNYYAGMEILQAVNDEDG